MAKKYKIDIKEAGDYKSLAEIVIELRKRGIDIEPFSMDTYADNYQRISVFNSAGVVLESVFNGDEQSVAVHLEDDTVGGEISVLAVDAVLVGDDLGAFIAAIESANEIEFSSSTDGHSEFNLIYTDLKERRGDGRES